MSPRSGSMIGFVTGASRGIGFHIARHVSQYCSHLFLAASTEGNIKDGIDRLSCLPQCKVSPLWGDLASGRVLAEDFARSIADSAPRLDLLVLNAGYYVDGSLASIEDHDFERNFQVNLMSSHYLISSLLPLLKKSACGKIIIVGSTAAYEAYPLVPTYGVAKWGLRGYAINLRKELAVDNIGVTFVSPGGTLTDMWEGVDLPPGRLLDPDDIGRVVAMLMTLSPQAVVEEVIVRPMLGDIHE